MSIRRTLICRLVQGAMLLPCLTVFNLEQAQALDLYALGSYWEIEDTEGSWGGGLGVAVPFLTDFLRLDARAYVFENSDLDDDDEIDIVPLDFGLQVHIFKERRLDPYLLGGVSYVYVDSERIDIDSDFGAYAGAGVDFELVNVIKLFAEGLYRFAELDDARFGSDEFEVSGISVNMGLKINF